MQDGVVVARAKSLIKLQQTDKSVATYACAIN